MEPLLYNQTIERAFAKHYAEASDVWTGDLAMRLLPPVIQGLLKLNRHHTVLDIGCGKGEDCLYFSSIVEAVTGIDFIQLPQWKSIEQQSGNVQFYKTSVYDFRTPHKYNLILDNGCLHHQLGTQLRAYLSAIRNLLGADGSFALSTFKNEGKADYYDANGRYHRYFSDEALAALLAEAGFVPVHQQDIYRNRTQDYYRIWLLRKTQIG